MAQKPEDFTLPVSAVKKILMDTMPSGVHVTDAAQLALSKAACVFILYVTTSASAISQDHKRKRILGKDVFDALKDLDLGFLIPKLNTALSEYHKSLNTKKHDKELKNKNEKSLINSSLDMSHSSSINTSHSNSINTSHSNSINMSHSNSINASHTNSINGHEIITIESESDEDIVMINDSDSTSSTSSDESSVENE